MRDVCVLYDVAIQPPFKMRTRFMWEGASWRESVSSEHYVRRSEVYTLFSVQLLHTYRHTTNVS